MKFSLVLSGGAALGFAHIGVYQYLEELDMIPLEISGTSMGAFIAALIATNHSSYEIKKIVEDFNNPLSFMSIFNNTNSHNSGNLIGNNKIMKILKKIFKNKIIGDSIIPLYISATNFENGKNIIFDNNIKIVDAVMASMSIPGIFSPVKIKNNIYVDGYLSQNLPTLKCSVKIPIIAIDVVSLNSLKPLKESNNIIKKVSMIPNIVERSFRLFIIQQTEENLKKRYVSYLIKPDTSSFTTSDFLKYKDIISLGYQHMKEHNYFNN